MSAPASTLRLGTRRSALALAQSGQVAREVERRSPGLTVELVPIVTRGDVYRGDLSLVGGKGLFTEELEAGLLSGALDLAVHSLKDLPVGLAPALEIAAYPQRADPRDVLVSELAEDLDGLPPGAVLLTGSLRRRAQILARRPDVVVQALRGNVDTRLAKWRESGAAGVLLARAGLERLGLPLAGPDALPAHPLPPEQMLPAPGQGTLALQVRSGGPAAEPCGRLHHEATGRAARAERLVVAAFGADCTLPLAAWARPASGAEAEAGTGILRITALLATPDGRTVARGEGTAADPEAAAEACIAALRADGADEVLERIRRELPGR
ncbi:MAG TPA: hydroxymethylbilane synthase [Thermoanaerobaculia bacterium]|nr:hydroxymethylbilane synthase [Thermoanaerobaculia bacterium]